MTSAENCVACAQGTFCPVGSEVATNCSAGTYNAQTGQQTCTACAAGTFIDFEGATACKPCTPGYYCTTGAAAALPCPGGTMMRSGVIMTSGDDCVICPEGTFCPVGSAAATNCTAGTFSDQPGQEACEKCAPGEFIDTEGATVCQRCTSGYYCKEGAASPIPCEGGTYGNTSGLRSSSECTSVAPGEWAPTGAAEPEVCFTGFRCPGRTLDRTNTPPGSKPILVSEGGSTFTEEVDVITQELRLDAALDEYNQTAVQQILAALYGLPTELLTLSVNGGSLLVTLTIQSTHATMPTSDLIARSLAINHTTLSTALGMSAIQVSPPHAEVQMRIIEAQCPRGHWCTAGLTVKCEVGFYNPTLSASSATACLKCPSSSTTLTDGSSALTDCLCERGFYNNGTQGATDCLECPVGVDCAFGSTLTNLALVRGYFRRTKDTIDVRRCPDGLSSGTGCVGGTTDPCAPTLSGVFCQLCRNASVPVYYAAATKSSSAACKDCGSTLAVTMAVGIGAVLSVLLLAAAAVRCGMRVPAWAARINSVYGLTTKFKILIGIYMIATRIGNVYNVPLPEEINDLLARISLTISFGLYGLAATPLECVMCPGAAPYPSIVMVAPWCETTSRLACLS